MEARTSATLTSRAALEENLRQVRHCGYAVTDEELEPGLVAVAAPVYRDGAVVVGALSVSAPASRLSPPRIPGVAGQCVTQALALSAVLGHVPLPGPEAPGPGSPRPGSPATR